MSLCLAAEFSFQYCQLAHAPADRGCLSVPERTYTQFYALCTFLLMVNKVSPCVAGVRPAGGDKWRQYSRNDSQSGRWADQKRRTSNPPRPQEGKRIRARLRWDFTGRTSALLHMTQLRENWETFSLLRLQFLLLKFFLILSEFFNLLYLLIKMAHGEVWPQSIGGSLSHSGRVSRGTLSHYPSTAYNQQD